MLTSHTPEAVKKIVGDTPNMTLEQGTRITEVIHESKSRNILELGIGHGVSACYMAAALKSAGEGGAIVSLDWEKQRSRSPNIEEFLEKCGYSDMVTVIRDPSSYCWQMMKFLRDDPTPRFDFCYLDGAHNWAVDGLAFYLVDRLLKPNGWIVFDDLDWTYQSSPALRDTDLVKNMPRDERELPQVRLVYELLVKTHPGYGEFRTEGEWAFARKLPQEESGGAVRTETVIVKHRPAIDKLLGRLARLLGR